MTNLVLPILIYAAIAGTVLLAVASIAVRFIREPARRRRVIQWALVACLVVPAINQLPLPQWHLGVISGNETQTTAEPTTDPEPETISDPVTEPPLEFTPLAKTDDPVASETVPEPGTDDEPAATIPAIAEAPRETTSPWNVSGIVLWSYVGIALLLAIWWIAGVLRLRSLVKTAVLPPEGVQSEFFSIAENDPRAAQVRVRMSDRIDMPMMCGYRRPVVLLPSALCASGNREAIRYCLAHEWAHIHRRDILPWYLATLSQFLYFYQPLFWWLRSQLRLSQDFLADSYAAARADVPEDYADFLVAQARRRGRSYAAALGFADKKSNLFRRVIMVLDDKPVESRCGAKWSSVTACVVAVAILATASLRLDAAKAPPAKPESPKKPTAEVKDETVGKEITYTGRVINRATKSPIEGVEVTIERTLSFPPKGMENFKKVTKVKTDAAGKYSFTLTSEETAQSSLYIVVDATHPAFAPKGRSGYSHKMIRKNLRLGEKPFYSEIKLWPGKEVTGVVVGPDGKPLPRVKVLTYAKHKKAKRFDFGGFFTTYTDDKGRFRFTAATPGEGVFWLYPAKLAPQAHMMPEERGDAGTFKMQKGTALKGVVLDARGKPVGGVNVGVRRRGDGNEDVDRFLGQNAVAGGIVRSTTAAKDGTFSVSQLPPGDYEVRIRFDFKDRTKSAPCVFSRQRVKLTAGETLRELKVQAVPHVEIHATYLDSAGKPTHGHQFNVFARTENGFFFARSNRPDKKTGKVVARIPHGATQVRLDLMTNEHNCLRWRKKQGDPLKNTRRVDLGTLEDDVHGFEIVRYTAPILLIKVVDEAGKIVRDAKPKGLYQKGKSPKDPKSRFINGIRGDIYFEQQTDGRWRSNQLFPDEKIAVIAEKAGYSTTVQSLVMKEGKEREIVFTLKRNRVPKKPAKNEAPQATIKRLGLREISSVTDSVTTRDDISFPAKKGNVKVAPGQIRLIEMAKPVRSFRWHLANFAEDAGVGADDPAFKFVLIDWKATGKIRWTFYRLPKRGGK